MSLYTKSLHWRSQSFRGDHYLPTPSVKFYESAQCLSILIPWTGQEHLQATQAALDDEIQKIGLNQQEQTTIQASITFSSSSEKQLYDIAQNINQEIYNTWNKEKLQCCIEMVLLLWKPDYLAWVNLSSLQMIGKNPSQSEILSIPNHLSMSAGKQNLPRVFLGEGRLQMFSMGSIHFSDWNAVHFLQGASIPLVMQIVNHAQSIKEYQKLIEVNSLQPFWIGSLSQDTSNEGDVVGSIQK